MSLLTKPKFKDCIVYSGNKPELVIKESGARSKMVVKNPSGKQLCQILIDSCVIKDNKKEKCDFLLEVSEAQQSDHYFIELKGKNFKKAVDQILSTISLLKAEIPSKKHARIVLSAAPSPKLTYANYLHLKKICVNSGGTIKKGSNNILTETL